ncbi:MAG: pyruvate formate-lyase [Clostridia bacterium]|nr:pyruvate formate-lyase [Clostridia bacterium]
MSNNLLNYITSKQHHVYRHDCTIDFAAEFSAKKLSPVERMSERFVRLMAMETPVILPDEKICFLRTVKNIPDCFTEAEWSDIRNKHFIHESGYMSNLSPDYEKIISHGLLAFRDEADVYGKAAIDAIIDLADRYKTEAKKTGRDDIAQVLERVPCYGASSFREALQMFRIVHYSLWLEGNYHNTVGRFDRYMYPYFKADMDAGVIDEVSALELIEDFFISFNKDSDLYPGVQQGDNGQSMVLGGMDEDGNEVFSDLSRLCLEASRNLLLIDPKINLRVNRNTPIEIYELGSELTKAGLGFPQYSNDDVVVDGLTKLGYELADARNYAVAACWEFIIPHVGCDVANIGALSFPKIIDICLHKHLESCESFDEFMEKVRMECITECDEMCGKIKDLWFVPSPFMNVCMDCDIYTGGKYNNFGFHGTGIATATDSLAVIKKYVFGDKSVTKAQLIEAVDSDYEKHSELLAKFRYEAPKFGNNDNEADSLAVALLDIFADSLEGKTNCRGGKFRAGTGSAMFYLWHAAEIGASPDGRRKGEAFGTNFSASLFAKLNGPLSIISSFAKPHFDRAINGGPLTLEFHNSMFSDDDCIHKVAMLVKSYMDMGGHQLQLNAVNPEKMKDAQLHPENHRSLVVRIWGWSAYFVELDKEFQDHVMARAAYRV